MRLVIDGDIIAFRAAASAEDAEHEVIPCTRAGNMLAELETSLMTEDFASSRVWLSGPVNFRYGVFPEYKRNRRNAQRPKWEKEVKQYLVQEWGALYSEGCEADDMLGVDATEEPGIICTIDKDLLQIPGKHFNFVNKVLFEQTPQEATKFFYYQCLVGDSADGIKGAPGIGPVKANNILGACGSEEEMYHAVVDQFPCYEAFEMTAKVVHIWKKHNDIWQDKFL